MKLKINNKTISKKKLLILGNTESMMHSLFRKDHTKYYGGIIAYQKENDRNNNIELISSINKNVMGARNRQIFVSTEIRKPDEQFIYLYDGNHEFTELKSFYCYFEDDDGALLAYGTTDCIERTGIRFVTVGECGIDELRREALIVGTFYKDNINDCLEAIFSTNHYDVDEQYYSSLLPLKKVNYDI